VRVPKENLLWENIPNVANLRPDKLGVYYDGLEQRQSHPLALTQLLITYHMIRAKEAVTG